MNVCVKCGNKIDYRNITGLCNRCVLDEKILRGKSITIKELKSKHSHKKVWYSSEIRNFARTWNKTLVSSPCQKCGYDKHTELCHIKAINDYDDNSTLSEVNNPNNIVILCPNHHWEFDNGLLQLKDIPKRMVGQAGVEPT